MTEPSIDFAVLDLDTRQLSVLNRRAMTWLVGMLLLVTLSIVLLALFLRTVEAQEEDRRRTADAQWLDQTVRFHLRRLEADLGVLALQVQRNEEPAPPALPGGQLWRSAQAIAWHGWLAADRQPTVAAWPLFLQSAAKHPGNAEALSSMLKTTRGLQRPAYAGPLPQAGDSAVQMLWLAVPVFERDRFLGDYVAAIRFDWLLDSVIPPWFFKDHAVALDADAFPFAAAPPDKPSLYVAPVNLPGAPLRLRVDALNSRPALAPRIFFGIALACLAGMVVALYFLRRDTARRQRAESQLQTQMALRTAMERSVTLGLRAWNPDGRLLYANQTFCRMVGLAPRDILGHAAAEAMPYWPAGQGDEFGLLLQSARLPMAQQTGVEMQLRHSQGHLLDVLAHGAPLMLADGRVIGWMGSVLDITERKRVERLAARRQELLEASGRLIAVGEVASTLAHELNQPLGALSSFANGLLNRMRAGSLTLEEVTPVVERMERLAEKAGRVIQRVNAFARRQEMNFQPLALNEFIARVAGHVPLPDGLELQLRLPDQPLTLPADGLLLEHALHNLVLNATEWAIHGGQQPACVRISLEQSEGLAGIRVEDNGPGVPPEQRNRIFDAFASQKTGGMGMGLSICRSIIEAHHGRIDVATSADLNGAQFTVWLPLTIDPGTP